MRKTILIPKYIQFHKTIVLERLKGGLNDEAIKKAIENGTSPFDNIAGIYEDLKTESPNEEFSSLDHILDCITKHVMQTLS